MRGRWKAPSRLAFLLATLGLVALLDHRFSWLLPLSHLYYLPILLAALWFGYVGGLAAAAIAVGLFHVTHFFAMGLPVHVAEADLLRFTLFVAVGLVTAKLVDDRARIQRMAEALSARNAELSQLNDRLSELSGARADFVAIASHELKNALAGILGSAQVLARTRPTDPSRYTELVHQIEEAVWRLQRIVASLLDASLIETGRFRLHREEVKLVDLLAACPEMFSRFDAVRLKLPDEVPPVVVQGDRDKLTQVLVNLIGNALKYSPSAEPVTLAVEARDGTVRIAVSDRGYGIPPDDLPHIFDRYHRAKDGKVRATRGAGLGLSISRDIVRAHGGELLVQSEPGDGSTFTVVLPVEDVATPFDRVDPRSHGVLSMS